MSLQTNAWTCMAAVVDYPEPGFTGILNDCLEALAQAASDVSAPVRTFRDAVGDLPLERVQELYVEAFDLDPDCSLNLGWHLFADTHLRGEMLAALQADLEHAGMRPAPELPDHLSQLLMLLAADERAPGGELAAFILPAVSKVTDALRRRRSPYATLLLGVEAMVAGHARNVERTTP